MNLQLQNQAALDAFRLHLTQQERSEHTITKYTHDVTAFLLFVGEAEVACETVAAYKKHLMSEYAPTSVNSKLAAINSFVEFCGHPELRVKPLKLQKSLFAEEEKELSKAEYQRLLSAAKHKKNERLSLVMQTICATGIRVSELQYITVEAAKKGRAEVYCKNKRRTIFITPELAGQLRRYAKGRKIKAGAVFCTRNGNPLSRHRIWADMKALCASAGVDKRKVFPHNLRHLFARTFYAIEKDLGRLADVLGHSNINTTRIYIMESGHAHMKILRSMGLLANRNST